MEENRRRVGHPRFPLRVPALVEEVAAAGSPRPGLTRNLSRGGLGLLLRQEAQRGTSLRVTLRLRHRVPLPLTGTVRWVRPSQEAGWDLGMQFDEELAAHLVATIAQGESPA